jgi:hypothetical protein
MQGDLNKARERIRCGAIVVATMADAQEQIRLLIEQLVPLTERQAPPGAGQMVMPNGHPTHYPSNVDVRPVRERVPAASVVNSGIQISN